MIPVYNGELLVGRCLESVFRQSYCEYIEVIVVDDGSTDRTVEVVEGFKDSRICVISQKNQGPAAARNAGIERAKGQYLAFLDADDYWEPGFLEHTVGFLDNHPEAIAVSVGQVHKVLGKPPAVVPRFLQDAASSRKSEVLESFFAFWAEHNHVCTGSVLMRTDIVRQSGGQRTELRICEDLEFWAYLATFGKWGFIPELLFVSGGGVIVQTQGYEKYRLRLRQVPTYKQWLCRLDSRLSEQDRVTLRPLFYRVIAGTSRALIIEGRFGEALVNLHECSFEEHDECRLCRYASKGNFIWHLFCLAYRYRFLLKHSRAYLNVAGWFRSEGKTGACIE